MTTSFTQIPSDLEQIVALLTSVQGVASIYPGNQKHPQGLVCTVLRNDRLADTERISWTLIIAL